MRVYSAPVKKDEPCFANRAGPEHCVSSLLFSTGMCIITCFVHMHTGRLHKKDGFSSGRKAKYFIPT